MANEHLITAKAAADELGITDHAVRVRLRRGTLNGKHENGRHLVRVDELFEAQTLLSKKNSLTRTGGREGTNELLRKLQADVDVLRVEIARLGEIIINQRK